MLFLTLTVSSKLQILFKFFFFELGQLGLLDSKELFAVHIFKMHCQVGITCKDWHYVNIGRQLICMRSQCGTMDNVRFQAATFLDDVGSHVLLDLSFFHLWEILVVLKDCGH